MKNLELLFIALLGINALVVGIDFIVYTFKSPPKRAKFSRTRWFFAFWSAVVVAYWFLNSMKFF